MNKQGLHQRLSETALIGLLTAAAVAAQAGDVATNGSAAASKEEPLEVITVTAAKMRTLEQFTPTGSRLGLSAQEIPGTLEVIDSDEILGRGFANVEQAADSQAGVTSGGSPGDQSQFSMRGFTGDQVTMLRNGLYVGPANMIARSQNAFNVGSVEILKGPASVLYGQGAIAGVVNVVDKAPSFGPPRMEALAAIGNFGATNVGIGGSTHFGSTFAIRADISRTSTQGYVQRDPSNTDEATVTALWKPTTTLDVQLTIDFLEDNPSRYFGTPLVPATFATDPLNGVISSSTGQAVDQRMRFVNYNVADSRIHSSQYWPQLLLKWTPSDKLTMQNFTYYFHAHRQWIDAETYQFTTVDLNGSPLESPQINRDRFYVFHQQQLLGDEGSLTYKGKLLGKANTFVLGFDYSHLNFVRTRGFPNNDLVDPFEPSPGLFGPLLQPGELVARKSPTHWNDFALFFEDVINLTAPLKLVTGGRYDRLALERQNFNTAGIELANGFKETYSSTNWRVGLVYNLGDFVTPYVSWTTGKDPPGTNDLFLVNAPEGQFALSDSNQVEAGVKARSESGLVDMTLSLYSIQKKNMLIQTTQETLTNGSETSKGAEFSTNFKISKNWTVSANTAYTNTTYSAFTDPASGNNYFGNQPVDIPRWTGNLWTSVRDIAKLPLELGGGIRYIGNRYGDAANTLLLKEYALINVYASYEVKPGVLVSARINNLLDKAYAQWADIYYPPEIMLGQPRYFELSVYTKF
jgi:iron complex outermembrane recepter protein